MTHNIRFEQLLKLARPFYDNGDPSHDIVHIERVVANCERIGRTVGANLETLLPAAVLHDIVNLPKNHPERSSASSMAAKKAAEVLATCGYSDKEIESIEAIIVEHSYSLGKKPSSIESAVLQDSDKLDALGAIGIMRTITVGARMGCNYYDADDFLAAKRPLNDKAYSIDHFFTKLFKLPDLMNTDAARAEAAIRVTYMRNFLETLRAEIGS